MSNFVRQIGNCCAPCTTPQVINTPGPQGDPGNDGADGADGIDGFTTVTDITGPLMPAIGATVNVEMGSVAWMVVDQILFIGPKVGSAIGSMKVISFPGGNVVELENLGYSGNAAPGTVIANGYIVSPSGPQGISAAGTSVQDSQALTSGVSSQVITAPGGAFGFTPNVVVATIHKPPGGMNIFVTVHTITATTFTAVFSATIPASGYSIDYVAFPP